MMESVFQQYLEETMKKGIEEKVFTAGAAAIGCRDQVWAQFCCGEAPLPGGQKVDERTLFDAASLTKILAPTMLVLRGTEAGEISLDETVADFFDDVPEDKRNLTIRMLMTHTAGFQPSHRLDFDISDPADTVKCILSLPLTYAPGTQEAYSCVGFILLGKMLEKRYGKPLDILARERVFGPLAMADTGYCPEDASHCAATECDQNGQPLVGVVHDEDARFLGGVAGNAGIFLSLRDGVRYASMVACMGGNFLKKETMQQAIFNYTPGKAENRGLGFHLSGNSKSFFCKDTTACFGHTGFTGTSLAVDSESGVWILLLTNRVYPTRANNRHISFRRKIHSDIWKLCGQLK